MSVLLLSTPQSVSATPNKFEVVIEHADYGDFDTDSYEDDVVIIFTCRVLEGAKSPAKTDVYFTLTLPSGQQHFALVTIVGKYTEISLGMYRFNVATEPGWYNIVADAYTYGGPKDGTDSDVLVFDPPGSGTGDPEIRLFRL
jgi:hypothetical protein